VKSTYISIGLLSLVGGAVALWWLANGAMKQPMLSDREVIAAQSKSIETNPVGSIAEDEIAPIAVSTPESNLPKDDKNENISLVGKIKSHGSAEYLDARDKANAIASSGYKKLRWEIFRYDGSAIDQFIESASLVSKEDLQLNKAIQVIPFDDDKCTLSELSRIPRIDTASSELWTIVGRCSENSARKVTLYISRKHHQMKGRVSTGGLLHYEIAYVSESFVLFSELDRNKLPRNRH